MGPAVYLGGRITVRGIHPSELGRQIHLEAAVRERPGPGRDIAARVTSQGLLGDVLRILAVAKDAVGDPEGERSRVTQALLEFRVEIGFVPAAHEPLDGCLQRLTPRSSY